MNVDRVEWVITPDSSVAFSLLRRGEVDMLDAPPLDLLATVAGDPNIVIGVRTPSLRSLNCLPQSRHRNRR
jgi:hypothetical protein